MLDLDILQQQEIINWTFFQQLVLFCACLILKLRKRKINQRKLDHSFFFLIFHIFQKFWFLSFSLFNLSLQFEFSFFKPENWNKRYFLLFESLYNSNKKLASLQIRIRERQLPISKQNGFQQLHNPAFSDIGIHEKFQFRIYILIINLSAETFTNFANLGKLEKVDFCKNKIRPRTVFLSFSCDIKRIHFQVRSLKGYLFVKSLMLVKLVRSQIRD